MSANKKRTRDVCFWYAADVAVEAIQNHGFSISAVQPILTLGSLGSLGPQPSTLNPGLSCGGSNLLSGHLIPATS